MEFFVGSWKVLIQINQLFQNQKWDIFLVKEISSNKKTPFSISSPHFTTCRSLHRTTLVLCCSLGARAPPRWDHHGTLGAASGGHTTKQLERSSALGATWSSGWRCWSGMKCWWTKILQISSYRWWFLKYVFMFTPIFGGRWSNVTYIFQMGWNHQLVQF